MRPWVRLIALSALSLIVWMGVSRAAEREIKSTEPGGVSFQTLDGDSQQVDVAEIWRIRETNSIDEPPGAVVIDYAFERLYVKDTLNNVVRKVEERRKVERFTLPSGAPIYIVPDKVIGVSRAIPGQHHPKAHAIIIAREGQQQVQETRETVREALKK
jgi:hypothetical protein